METKRLRELLAGFLQSIPQSNQKAKSIEKLIPAKLTREEKKQLISSIKSLVLMLKLFGSVSLDSSERIKARSEAALYFLHSLAIYVQEDLNIISSWDRPGLPEEFDFESILSWGTQFLYLMEMKRTEKLGSKKPTREVEVSQVIIKAKVNNFSEPLYLVQYDPKAQKHQLVGGSKLDKDKDPLGTIKRELKEELPLNKFILDDEYKLKKLVDGAEFLNLSPTYGAFTKYTFSVYQIFFGGKEVKIGKSDRWVSATELREGVTRDGVEVANFFQYEKYFKASYENLPLSTKKEQVWSPAEVKFSKKLKAAKHSTKIINLITAGESEEVEFKTTSRWDLRQNKINKDLEKVILKTIAGFMNGEGGNLLIGVDDDGGIVGIERDMQTLKKKNIDGFMQNVMVLVTSHLGVEYARLVKIRFEKVGGKTVCLVGVDRSSEPVFLEGGDGREFHARVGNTTRLFDSKEVYDYIRLHW